MRVNKLSFPPTTPGHLFHDCGWHTEAKTGRNFSNGASVGSLAGSSHASSSIPLCVTGMKSAREIKQLVHFLDRIIALMCQSKYSDLLLALVPVQSSPWRPDSYSILGCRDDANVLADLGSHRRFILPVFKVLQLHHIPGLQSRFGVKLTCDSIGTSI
jgi:hypothetical protein